MADVRQVHATYDPDARAWWAESDDIEGLVSEAPTLERLMDRVTAIVPDLLQLNEGAVHDVSLEFYLTDAVSKSAAGRRVHGWDRAPHDWVQMA